MTLAIAELVTYLNDLSDMSIKENLQSNIAIDSQFKEIKHVINTGEFNLEDLDEDSLREKIALQNDIALTRTDSKKYGPSTQILVL